MKTYTTIQGDTWDKISVEVYGSESYTSLLMEHNPKLLDYFVFPAGIVIVVPEKPEETDDMPDWRS